MILRSFAVPAKFDILLRSCPIDLRELRFGYLLYLDSRYRTVNVYANSYLRRHDEIELEQRFVVLSYDDITSTLIWIFSHILYISAHLDRPGMHKLSLARLNSRFDANESMFYMQKTNEARIEC